MGYTTDFRGGLEITPNISDNHKEFINKFSETRRMKRDSDLALSVEDGIRAAVGLPIGEDGGYFVGSDQNSIIDRNVPPKGQPGLWCQWVIEGEGLVWDEGEKFYFYVEWLQYIVDNFLEPWGYTLNGEIEWRGEEWDDTGIISVLNNKITIK